MTETEKMRAILRERGIEYRDVNSMVTDIEHDGIKTRVYDYDDGPDYQLCVEQKWLTAEEAVTVALGIKPQEVLERRIDELCQEVEQLRKQLHDQQDTAKHNFVRNAREYKRVCDENDRLRKLALDMYRCSDPCNDCPHYNGSNDGFYCDLGIGWKARRMRELGIEVKS